MRIHRSGDKSAEFFSAYINLILTSEKASFENDMKQHFFQHDTSSLGPVTFENFQKALLNMKRNEE